jgi:hypothetical protein
MADGTSTNDATLAAVARRWVVRHLLEHDLHHGGELASSLGAHGLPAPRL